MTGSSITSEKNEKCDVKAKNAYKKYLESHGYFDVKRIGSPADIIAQKNGQTYYFEIKMTKRRDNYFGASTLTEWLQALKRPTITNL